MGKHGFTLAEVLMTLGIIGVVAAMTIPTLIANHRAKELNTRLNTAYSLLSQAIDKMYADGISISPDDYEVKEFKKVFKPYFIESKDCGNHDCITYPNDTEYRNYPKIIYVSNTQTW